MSQSDAVSSSQLRGSGQIRRPQTDDMQVIAAGNVDDDAGAALVAAVPVSP